MQKNLFIVWGQGVILGGAEDEFRALWKSPVFCRMDYFGTIALPTAHPLNVGMVGMHEITDPIC